MEGWQADERGRSLAKHGACRQQTQRVPHSTTGPLTAPAPWLRNGNAWCPRVGKSEGGEADIARGSLKWGYFWTTTSRAGSPSAPGAGRAVLQLAFSDNSSATISDSHAYKQSEGF